VFSFRVLGRVALGVALVGVSTLAGGSAQAAVPSGVGPRCTVQTDTPIAGETTLTDSTLPALTSVTWAHKTLTVKPKSSVRITVKLSDNCSGAGDVVLELHNATTRVTGYFGADYVSSKITSAGIYDTWTVDVPLYGTDAGSISVAHVAVTTGFTSLVYTSATGAVVSQLPEVDQVTPSDYHNLTPHRAARITVKASTTVAVTSAKTAKRGHAIALKATLKELKTSSYVGLGRQHVTIQYKAPGGSWHALKRATTASSGTAALTYKPTKSGTYSFRVLYAGSTYIASATSAVGHVKVS
jgi:hypothetical protein